MSARTAMAYAAGEDRRRRSIFSSRFAFGLLGVLILLGCWWVGGLVLMKSASGQAFAGFAPGPTFASFVKMLGNGAILHAALPSLGRIFGGLLVAILLGVPLGIALGRLPALQKITHVPFQFLRMISPLSWMPIAVLAFPSWNGATMFLIAAAAIWPVTFATANGVAKLDPAWLKLARNLGASLPHRLAFVILPAIAQDMFTGIRLALGVAWIVLVPAEYLGVSSGLGYAINDARDSLDYAQLTAIVLVIGILGFSLDAICLFLIRRVSYHHHS